MQVGPSEEMTQDDFREAMRVHFWAPLRATLAVAPEMRRRGRGRIVNIASVGGLVSVPHMLPYCASKFALVGLSEGWRVALQKDGVYVTTVCPGVMRTGGHVNANFKGRHEQEFAWFGVAASAPGFAVHAGRAADQILRAARDGRALVIPAWPAKLLATLHALAPALTAEGLALVDRALPRPGGIGGRQASGGESRPAWLPPWLTRMGDRAAARNKELPPAGAPGGPGAL
ncbi:MAG: SDR family NAD(P)-dependent oxidoreductase [Botrimarina sp.]